MKKLNLQKKISQLVLAALLFQLGFGGMNFVQAIGPSILVDGQVALNGAPANGAAVILTNENTGSFLADTAGPTGSSSVSGHYLFDLQDLSATSTDGDVINIVATLNSITGTSTFIYSSSTASVIPATINLAGYMIFASAGANGTISPIGTSTVSTGSSSIFTITPDSGYQIASLLVDGTSTMATTSYTFTNVLANHTIQASFSPVPVLTTIDVTPATSSILMGATQQFSASPKDQFDSPIASTIVWISSNPAVATINANGLATGVATGTTSIIASSSGVVGTSTLTVTPIPVLTTMTISPASGTVSYIGDPRQYIVATLDQFGQPIAATTSWSIDNPAIGSIDSASGLFSPQATGTAVITVVAGSLNASTSVVIDADAVAPTIPDNLAANGVSGSNIDLTWTASTDNNRVAGYSIYRNGTSTVLATTSEAAFTDTGLTPLTAYSYTVVAFDPTGNISDFAASATSSTLAANILTSIMITPATSSIMLGATEQFSAAPLDQYGFPFATNVIWSINDLTVGTINSSTGLFSSLATGTAMITASSSGIVGTSTVTVIPDVEMPTVPANLIATAVSASRIDLSWAASTDNTLVSGYNIYRNNVAIASIGGTTFSDTGLAANTAYNYTVNAFDPSGNISAFASSVNARTNSVSSGGGVVGGTFFTPRKDSINAPLEMDGMQEGHALFNFNDTYRLKLDIPKGAVAVSTIFSANLQAIDNQQTKNMLPVNGAIIGDSLFNILATDLTGQAVRNFAKDITITFTMAIPNDTVNLGLYSFDSISQLWVNYPGAILNASNGQITLTTNHLTTFGLFRIFGLPSTIRPISVSQPSSDVGGELPTTGIFSNGTLVRASNMKIYIMSNGRRIIISSLKELAQYRGRKINNVSDQIMNSIPEAKKITNGTLIRGADQRIYIVISQKKVHIMNLTQLRKYVGKPIIKVDNDTKDAY